MVRGYETMVITHPEISDEEIQNLIDKINGVILKWEGESLKVENLGKRKLVYKIKGLIRGYFLLIYFKGQAGILQEIDTLLRYNERVLRYQTVKFDPKFPVELPAKQGLRETSEDAGSEGTEERVQEGREEKEVFQEGTEELAR